MVLVRGFVDPLRTLRAEACRAGISVGILAGGHLFQGTGGGRRDF